MIAGFAKFYNNALIHMIERKEKPDRQEQFNLLLKGYIINAFLFEKNIRVKRS